MWRRFSSASDCAQRPTPTSSAFAPCSTPIRRWMFACSYTSVTRTSERPDEVRTERYAAGVGPELLAINGEAPSPKALAKYEKERPRP